MAPFYHRRDIQDLHIAFCTTCYQTVAREVTEAALADEEKKHECPGRPLFGVAIPPTKSI
jgi:hypothetical protein